VKLGNSRSIIPAIILAIVAVVGVSSAVLATDPVGQTATNLVAGTLSTISVLNTDRIKFQTKDPTDVATYSVTYAPGGFSGWHTHPGVLLVTVQSGSVIRTVGCASWTYSAGQTFVESDEQAVGSVRNASASDQALLLVTQIVPSGSVRRVDAPDAPVC
jgi:quercetin dioxygenase-like cupin family protein